MFLYSQLQLFVSSKGDYWVKKILGDKLVYNTVDDQFKGSNTFGFNSSKTKDGNTYLAINTHQPLDGPPHGMRFIFAVRKEQISSGPCLQAVQYIHRCQ